MKYVFGRTVVIALGGSVVYPDEIDAQFLKYFKKFLAPFLRKKIQFVLVVGGGKLARRFQDAAHAVASVSDDDKDWLGIHATRLNGHLLRTIFRDVADPVMIDERGKTKKLKYPITIAAGWRPGWSTDYVAMQLAADFGVKEAIVAGKPTHVYNKDNMKHADATPFHQMTWREYRKLVPAKWKPGLHAPVDPVGAALGDHKKIKAIVIDGRNLENFGELLKGKEFQGTIIG